MPSGRPVPSIRRCTWSTVHQNAARSTLSSAPCRTERAGR